MTPATRARIAWALYDWANSPFNTLIIGFLFAAHFAGHVVGDSLRGQALWGYAMGAGRAMTVVASPLLGAVADAGGRRKPWLFGTTALCVLCCAGLTLVEPGDVALAMVLVAFAFLGFETATVFYNAMLPDIAPAERIGRWSGWAWSLGYFGGLAALVVALWLKEPRLIGPLCGLWLALFAMPLFLWTPDRAAVEGNVRQGLARLLETARAARAQRDLLFFLAGRMLYNNALVTVFVFGAVYAAGRFGMSLTEVGLFGITLNVTAGLGAWGFGWVDDRLGSKRAVLLSLAGLTVTGAGALLSESVTAMWCWAGLLGIFVGPSQAASRTLMARLSPPERLAEYFGLYTLSGNLTAFAGPVLVGLITQWSGDVRLGLVLVVAPMIALGALLLVPVNAGSGASR